MKHITNEAVEKVIEYANLDNYEISDIEVINNNGYYEVTFCAGFMKYEAYVDTKTLEVVGFNSEPTELTEVTSTARVA